ncbi:unnamed protein product [Callosobruchus maculatus]|uniref:Uncharacterized protein n=1 Tax=Callosobruchus maculatus TaxID=64391 RepID=A0A653CB94_CALMS|nr:unnamed protein product [Callosobruchus maculatus]
MSCPQQRQQPPPSSSPSPSAVGAQSKRQKRMGPAPFASFEDLSDELDSPDEKGIAGSVVRLPGIREDITPTTPGRSPSPSPYKGISLIGAVTTSTGGASERSSGSPQPKSVAKLAATPRIDISRASSSSHHDSRDSTPERDIFDHSAQEPATSTKLGLGFREDGTSDLRSSTEELDFQDANESRRINRTRPSSPCNLEECIPPHRKDSQCSDIVLLSISGRTSRLSSIGSQGSGHSGQSRLSNASHLSGISRCSSPHKMLLETSFCGAKPPDVIKTAEPTGIKEDMEKVLLSRKHDPTEAILAEGICIEKAIKKSPMPVQKQIPLAQRQDSRIRSDVTIKVDRPQDDCSKEEDTSAKLPSRFVSESGVEYFYIPLKGPLPSNLDKIASPTTVKAVREIKSASYQSQSCRSSKDAYSKPRAKSATQATSERRRDKEEPKYIRIKLKPDYCYSENDQGSSTCEIQKPDSLELSTSQITHSAVVVTEIPEAAKKPPLLNSPKATKIDPIDNIASVTPSPSVSRKNSFASLFRSKETIMSPESPGVSEHKRKNTLTSILGDGARSRSRSRSKSRDRDSHKSSISTAPSSTESIDSKSKHKSVLSLFKSSKKDKIRSESETSSQETLPSIEGIGKLEFKFNEPKKTHYENPLDAASIRIPLHSPEYYEKSWKTSSQDSQDTVIEVAASSTIKPEPAIQREESFVKSQANKAAAANSRQSSTSSENVVFTTKLDNEVFTTKLPKNLPKDKPKKEMNGIVEVETTLEVIKTSEVEIEVVNEVVKVVNEGQINTADVTEKKEDIKKPDTCDNQKDDFTEQKIGIRSAIPKINSKSQEKLSDSVSRSRSNSSLRKSELLKDKKVEKSTEKKVVEEDTRKSMEVAKRISQVSAASTVTSNADEEHDSSESERDTEEFARNRKDLDLRLQLDVTEPERKAIVLQQDSFEDELPYVPTTLPLERSAAVPIVPVRQRSTFEIKTCPIERPRSTTPINPSCLEEYCEEVMGTFNVESITQTIEKLRISLPRNESIEKGSKVKSPRKKDANWQEFAGKSIKKTTPVQSETPPPLPPKGIQKSWINFEEIPEKRKAPKRIQTIPSRSYIEVPESVLQESVIYNYVNPEECKCECHEISAKEREKRSREGSRDSSRESRDGTLETRVVQEDELPLLEDDNAEDEKVEQFESKSRSKLDVADCRSIVSDSSVDLSTCVEPTGGNACETSLKTPFTSDLGLSSNRSSIVSQEDHPSPDSPNAFPKIS